MGIWNDLFESTASGRGKGITNFPAVWDETTLFWDSHFVSEFNQQSAEVIKYEPTKLKLEKTIWSEMFLEQAFGCSTYFCSVGQ